MPAFNFQAQFAEDVEFGAKRQTIRAPRKDGRPHCKPGDTLKLYTGMRTKSCRLLGTAKCTRVRLIWIGPTGMRLDGRVILAGDALRGECEDRDNDFAKKDGFKGFMEMADWFQATHGLPFDGVVIEWDEPR